MPKLIMKMKAFLVRIKEERKYKSNIQIKIEAVQSIEQIKATKNLKKPEPIPRQRRESIFSILARRASKQSASAAFGANGI